MSFLCNSSLKEPTYLEHCLFPWQPEQQLGELLQIAKAECWKYHFLNITYIFMDNH